MRTVINTELVLRSRTAAVINLTVWFVGLQNWFPGGMQKHLELQTREAIECINYSVMGHSGGSFKDQKDSRNVDVKDCAHKISEGNKDSVGN